MNSECNVKDVTSKNINQPCWFHLLIIDETTIFLLDSFADPHSTWIETEFYLNDFQECDSQKVFQLDWSDWEMELSFNVIKQTK